MAECKCRIKQPRVINGVVIGHPEIVYCPTHAKAEAMAEALRELTPLAWSTARFQDDALQGVHDKAMFAEVERAYRAVRKALAALPEAPDA